MTPLLTALAEAYNADHPHLTIDIQRGGSALGQQLVSMGELDIGLVSYIPATPPDDLTFTPIARDAIAIILNKENQIEGLSLRELRDVFSGRLNNWQAVAGPAAPIQVVSRENGSGTRTHFEAVVMDSLPVTPAAIVLPNSQAVVDFVADQPDAVGYVSFAFVDERVYAVPVEGVGPKLDSLADNSYFLSRELAVVTRQPVSAEVEAFVNFILSPPGQAIVGQQWQPVR